MQRKDKKPLCIKVLIGGILYLLGATESIVWLTCLVKLKVLIGWLVCVFNGVQ